MIAVSMRPTVCMEEYRKTVNVRPQTHYSPLQYADGIYTVSTPVAKVDPQSTNNGCGVQRRTYSIIPRDTNKI